MSDSSSVVSGIEASRLKGVTIVKPIVYGNHSQHFGKKREPDGHTHDWTVYVKPFNNEDMSSYVKKVQFKLHDSYANCNRVVSQPRNGVYEVSESGWGEFEVQIKIHFHDSTGEKPVTFYHLLKLFHTQPGDSGIQTSSAMVQGKKTVVSESYDEIIFQDPTPNMNTFLTTARPLTLSAYKHTTDFEEKRTRHLAAVTEARTKVQEEIADLKEKVKLAKETILKFKAENAKAQNENILNDSASMVF